MNLRDFERMIDNGRIPRGYTAAILEAARLRLAHAYAEAGSALDRDVDLRPSLARLIREYAAVHGRTAAQQLQAFAEERNELFLDLSLRAWGLDLTS